VCSSPCGLASLACVALALLALALRKTSLQLPSVTWRVATAAALGGLVAFGGLTVQACSSGRDPRVPSFREQSVEITAVPDSAEFYLADAQQSPLAVVSRVASVVSRTALHPFGHVRFQIGKTGDPWGFVGNEEDRGSGISDFHARPYRPELGAFLAVDPLSLLTPEKLLEKPRMFAAYLYAIGDPINNSDPDGLEPKKGFWTRVGQNAIHLLAETACMSLGGCGYANAPAPGDRTYAQASPAAVALNLTAAHLAPRIDLALTSRILKGAPVRVVRTADDFPKSAATTAPVINIQKQAGHVPGTPQFANRVAGGKMTSAFFDAKQAEAVTIEAWQKGTPLGTDGKMKLYDFGKPVGVGPDGGGYQTQVRVSIDSAGKIHGAPWGPVFQGPLPR
jgi:RHS repeat-associated protein